MPETETTETQATGTQSTQDSASTQVADNQSFDFTKFIGADGKLMDGWKAGLPEDIRGELSLDTFGTVQEGFKQLVNSQKLIGKDKVILPTDKSTQAEIDAFQMRLGRPKTQDEYKMVVPQEMAEYYMPELINEFKGIVFKHGSNQKLVDDLWAFEQKRITAAVKQLADNEKQEFEAASKLIEEEAGEALDDQVFFANKLIADEVPDEAKRTKLLETLNTNSLRPYVINFLAGIQRKYREEHGGIPAGSGAGTGMTPAMMEAKAQELMATPGYVNGTLKDENPAMYERLTREITELYNRAGKKTS